MCRLSMSKKVGACETAAAYHIVSAMTGDDMPILSMFYGIVIYMYAFDNRRHHRPHFHAEFAEFSVVIAIDDGDVLDGDLPKAKMKLVQAWLEIHREDLMADWKLAVQGLPPQRIKPLD